MKRQESIKISAARAGIDDAEKVLRSAIDAILSAPRADKVTVSDAVNEALSRLDDARAILVELECPTPVGKHR